MRVLPFALGMCVAQLAGVQGTSVHVRVRHHMPQPGDDVTVEDFPFIACGAVSDPDCETGWSCITSDYGRHCLPDWAIEQIFQHPDGDGSLVEGSLDSGWINSEMGSQSGGDFDVQADGSNHGSSGLVAEDMGDEWRN